MFPGESPASSCNRLLKREIGLDIAAHRFSTISYGSMVWGMREQQPQNHGTCDINIVLTAQLTDEEAARIKLDDKEYADMTWISAADLMHGNYHPSLKHSARNLVAHNKMAEMEARIKEGAGDADIAALARELYQLKQAVPEAGVSEYKCVSEERQYECAVTLERM
jgi:hypothetical protein